MSIKGNTVYELKSSSTVRTSKPCDTNVYDIDMDRYCPYTMRISMPHMCHQCHSSSLCLIIYSIDSIWIKSYMRFINIVQDNIEPDRYCTQIIQYTIM